MPWRNAPALTAILADANRVAPNRSHASDGTIGDTAHAASKSDHNPDFDGVVHACDITHDPAHGMDTWYWAQIVADRIRAGAEKRVKYLVSNDGTVDVIFNPSVSLLWRQNGTAKQDHRNHLHVSILYTDQAENDTSPFFVAGTVPTPEAPDLTPEESAMLKDVHAALPLIRDTFTLLTAFRNGWTNSGEATDAKMTDRVRALRQHVAEIKAKTGA